MIQPQRHEKRKGISLVFWARLAAQRELAKRALRWLRAYCSDLDNFNRGLLPSI